MNSVHLVGHLGADPELRFTPAGKAVANIRVATNEGKDQTEWHHVVCWEKTAELVGEFCRKGKLVGVQGRLQTREYTDKEGVKRWATEIVANRVEFLGGKQDGDAAPASGDALAERSSAAPASSSRASSGSLPTTFPNYGGAKNEPIAGAAEKDLEFYAGRARQTLADPEKSKFHAKERLLLEAIDAERGRVGTAAPASGGASSDDDILPF